MKLETWVKLMRLGKLSGCHQMPARSFRTKEGYQHPVCARCLGVLIGNAAAIVGAFVFVPHWLILMACCGVMFVDWLLQRLRIIKSTNPRRLATGVIGGYGLFTLLYVYVLWSLVQRIFAL